MKAIVTEYGGYKFRSRLEARWTVFLDAVREPWEYEVEGYDVDEAATCARWAGNDYRPQSIAKMVECYDKRVRERDNLTSYNHVRNQPTQREAIAEEQDRIDREIGGLQ